MPADLPVSLPSKLVEQRPDIRAYAALLHSATAAVGVATANMLPQISLTGSYGRDGSDFSNLFSPAGIVWSIAGSISQPIFEGGTLTARKRAAQAALDVAAAQYSSTVNTAFQNVANALVAIERDAETLQAALAAQKTAAASLAVATLAIPGRRRHLSQRFERRTDRLFLAPEPDHRPGRSVHRYRRAVPGARRRLVEPGRCGSESRAFPRSFSMNDATTLPRTTVRRPRTWLRMAVMLLLVGLLAAGLIWFQQFKAGMIRQVVTSIKSAVPTVATAKASMQDWQPRQTAVGSARASNGADLAAEIGGVVDQIDFESGQNVPAGTVLLRLRPNDDDAKLAQLQASAELAAVTLRRDQLQLAAHGVAQATVDSDAANLKVARAQVAAQQAVMAEKVIRAPFAGRLGVRQVDLGQYIAAGTAIVTLQQLDPMFVDFYLPQQALGQVAVGQKVDGVRRRLSEPDVRRPGVLAERQDRSQPAGCCRSAQPFRTRMESCCPGCISNVSVDSGAATVAGHHPGGGGGVQSVRLAGLRAARRETTSTSSSSNSLRQASLAAIRSAS